MPAGDTQPLFADRDLATSVANALSEQDPGVCVAPVWSEYAWRSLVAFHAAWGSEAEPRRVFIVDDPSSEGPVDALVAELTEGFADTLRRAESWLHQHHGKTPAELAATWATVQGLAEESAAQPPDRLRGELDYTTLELRKRRLAREEWEIIEAIHFDIGPMPPKETQALTLQLIEHPHRRVRCPPRRLVHRRPSRPSPRSPSGRG